MQGRVQGICIVPLKGLQGMRSVVLFSDNTVGHFEVSNSNHNNHNTTTTTGNDNTTTATTTSSKRNNK